MNVKKNNKSGMNLIELLIFMGLFALGFVPGHYIALEHGVLSGALVGAYVPIGLMMLIGGVSEFFSKRKEKKSVATSNKQSEDNNPRQ